MAPMRIGTTGVSKEPQGEVAHVLEPEVLQDLLFLGHLAHLVGLGPYSPVPGQGVAHLGGSGQEGASHTEYEAAGHPFRGFLQLVERVGPLVYGVLRTIWGALPLLGP